MDELFYDQVILDPKRAQSLRAKALALQEKANQLIRDYEKEQAEVHEIKWATLRLLEAEFPLYSQHLELQDRQEWVELRAEQRLRALTSEADPIIVCARDAHLTLEGLDRAEARKAAADKRRIPVPLSARVRDATESAGLLLLMALVFAAIPLFLAAAIGAAIVLQMVAVVGLPLLVLYALTRAVLGPTRRQGQ